MDSRFLLRRAIATDNIALSQLHQRTFLETYIDDFAIPVGKDDIESYFSHSVSPETFAKKIADPRQAIWIIEDKINGEFVAFVSVGPCFLPHPDVRAGEEGEFDRMYVRRDRQGCGLGQCLMNVALSWLAEQFPGRPVWLGVWKGNLKAQKLYEHYNFRTVGERDHRVGEYKFDSFIMRRESSSS